MKVVIGLVIGLFVGWVAGYLKVISPVAQRGDADRSLGQSLADLAIMNMAPTAPDTILFMIAGGCIGAVIGAVSGLRQKASDRARLACPHCAEPIRPEARVCPHCRNDIPTTLTKQTTPTTLTKQTTDPDPKRPDPKRERYETDKITIWILVSLLFITAIAVTLSRAGNL